MGVKGFILYTSEDVTRKFQQNARRFKLKTARPERCFVPACELSKEISQTNARYILREHDRYNKKMNAVCANLDKTKLAPAYIPSLAPPYAKKQNDLPFFMS